MNNGGFPMKALVVYFSRVGENSVGGKIEVIRKGYTEIVAEKIAKYANAELYQLVPENEYPYDYANCVRRAREESEENTKVPFKNPKENLDDYDVIFVGFPNWYRSYPRIVATFLAKYSFVGKVVAPFCTNEEGAFGIGESELRFQVKGAIIKNGFACRGYDAEGCDQALVEWLKKVLE